MWAHRIDHEVEHCPKCGGEMQKNMDNWYCKKCNYGQFEGKRERKKHYVFHHTPRMGSSLETTLNYTPTYESDSREADENWVNPRYVERLLQAKKSYVKALFRNPREKNLWYFTHTTCIKHPEIGKWFDDPNVSQTIRDDVERLYTLPLGEIQGKRPEYIMTVLCQIIYDAHNLPFEPPKFLENLNMQTFVEYYEFVWTILTSKKIKTLLAPGAIIHLKKRFF